MVDGGVERHARPDSNPTLRFVGAERSSSGNQQLGAEPQDLRAAEGLSLRSFKEQVWIERSQRWFGGREAQEQRE